MAISTSDFDRMARDYAAAWTSHDPDRVAAFFTEDGEIVINSGAPIRGRAAISRDCVSAFYEAFPNLVADLDTARLAGHHAVFLWTLEGNHVRTGNRVRVRGWDAWELSDDLEVRRSHVYFDAAGYQRQIEGAD